MLSPVYGLVDVIVGVCIRCVKARPSDAMEVWVALSQVNHLNDLNDLSHRARMLSMLAMSRRCNIGAPKSYVIVSVENPSRLSLFGDRAHPAGIYGMRPGRISGNRRADDGHPISRSSSLWRCAREKCGGGSSGRGCRHDVDVRPDPGPRHHALIITPGCDEIVAGIFFVGDPGHARPSGAGDASGGTLPDQ